MESSENEPARYDMPNLSAGFDDIILGYRFCATLQLRTPLRVLKQHGRFAPKENGTPPVVTREMWEGIWIPETKPLWPSRSDGTMASEVGQIPCDGGDYLLFLIAVRTVTEGGADVRSMEAALRELTRQVGKGGTSYSTFIGEEALIDRTLPRMCDLLPIAAPARGALLAANLRTIRQVSSTTDSELLALKGVGPKAVKAVREFLMNTELDKDAYRVLNPAFAV